MYDLQEERKGEKKWLDDSYEHSGTRWEESLVQEGRDREKTENCREPQSRRKGERERDSMKRLRHV